MTQLHCLIQIKHPFERSSVMQNSPGFTDKNKWPQTLQIWTRWGVNRGPKGFHASEGEVGFLSVKYCLPVPVCPNYCNSACCYIGELATHRTFSSENFIQHLFTFPRSRSKFFHKSSQSQLARSDRQTDNNNTDRKHSSRIYKPLSW